MIMSSCLHHLEADKRSNERYEKQKSEWIASTQLWAKV